MSSLIDVLISLLTALLSPKLYSPRTYDSQLTTTVLITNLALFCGHPTPPRPDLRKDPTSSLIDVLVTSLTTLLSLKLYSPRTYDFQLTTTVLITNLALFCDHPTPPRPDLQKDPMSSLIDVLISLLTTLLSPTHPNSTHLAPTIRNSRPPP